MKTIYSSISKRVFSLLVALIMAISTVPFAAASAFAQEQGISITTSTITPNTKSVEVTLAQDITAGFAKVIQLGLPTSMMRNITPARNTENGSPVSPI